MVSLECPASLPVLKVTAFGHWAKVSLHWTSLFWWLWVQSCMVLSSLGSLPTPQGQEGTWHTPCWGFYYLFLTRLTTATFCSHRKFCSKPPLARVGFVARVFKSPLRMQPRVLPLWLWMAVLYLLVGQLLLCINTRVGVLCMTACPSHWFHQYYFVIACLCDWVSVHFRAPVYWIMMSGIGLFDWVMASFQCCKWMCPSPVSLSQLRRDHLH